MTSFYIFTLFLFGILWEIVEIFFITHSLLARIWQTCKWEVSRKNYENYIFGLRVICFIFHERDVSFHFDFPSKMVGTRSVRSVSIVLLIFEEKSCTKMAISISVLRILIKWIDASFPFLGEEYLKYLLFRKGGKNAIIKMGSPTADSYSSWEIFTYSILKTLDGGEFLVPCALDKFKVTSFEILKLWRVKMLICSIISYGLSTVVHIMESHLGMEYEKCRINRILIHVMHMYITYICTLYENSSFPFWKKNKK